MTCDEFERVLPELEGGHNREQEEHLRTCPSCSDLVSDLNAIEHEARLLQDHEPSPRVWNAIEAALRQEGLIRQPQPQVVPTVARPSRWRFAWLVPITAALVWGFALLIMHRHVNGQLAQQQPVPPPVVEPAAEPAAQTSAVLADEDQLLKLIATRAPAMRAAYESDLQAVEAYIRDAELSARNDPNDEIAQQHLMNAYEQKAMVYEMAMNRAMP